MSGIGFSGLSLCYLLVDHFDVWGGVPFRAVGSNSILIYVGHSLLGGFLPFSVRWDDTPSHEQLLTSNLIGTIMWVIIAHVLYQKRVFFKV